MHLISFSLLEWSDAALLVLRLSVGALLIAHGWPKLTNLKSTGETFQGMGFRPGMLFGTVAAILETCGGLAIIVGIFTQVAALLLALQFVVITIWKIMKKQPFVGGWELDLILLAALFVLMTMGAGVYGADIALPFWL